MNIDLKFITIMMVIVIVCTCGCNYKKGKGLEKINSNICRHWKQDSLGCIGFRKELLENDYHVFDTFIGTKYSDFCNCFGTGRSYNKNGNFIKYSYLVDCWQGTDSGAFKELVNDAELLIIDVDKSYITDIHPSLP